MDPTVIAAGAEAGEKLLASWLSLPAQTTTVKPALTAAPTAWLRASDLAPPKDIFATFPPVSAPLTSLHIRKEAH